MRSLDIVLSEKNNFDALRFFAAVGVIFSHAHPVTQGSNKNEFLYQITSGQSTVGEVCVMIFFVISRFLITKSFIRSNSIVDYMTNRIIRIVPALFVVVLITCFVLGPIFTELTSDNYWRNPRVYRYLGNIFIYPAAQILPGVFHKSVYPDVINASIWTLSYEFSCYTGVAAIGLFYRKNFLLAFLMFTFTVASIFMTWISPKIFISFAAYFISGGAFYLLRKYIILDIRLSLVCIVILGCSIYFNLNFEILFYLFGTYLIIYTAYCPYLKMEGFARYGDFSYGTYVYAFPIQQILSPFTLSPLSNFLLSTPIILICALFSWHAIENPALSRKRKISNTLKEVLLKKPGRMR